MADYLYRKRLMKSLRTMQAYAHKKIVTRHRLENARAHCRATTLRTIVGHLRQNVDTRREMKKDAITR